MKQWKHLRVQNGQLPSLLVKAAFDKHGYSIKLTDLSRIWSETLSKDEIVTRAKKHNCSIDPGEDVGQYNIFLDKLQSAVNQDDKTNLAISFTNDGKLKMHLDAPLPSPLPTFEWELDLKRIHDSVTSAELVSPLLRRAHILNHCIESLVAEIQAKDKVIAKITDRLETSGHDLTAVFPGVSNVKLTRGESQQEQLGRHIRGLGKFDEATWKTQVAAANDTNALPESSEDAVFASLPQPSTASDDADKTADWWQQIPVGQHIDLDERTSGDAPGGDGDVLNSQQSPMKQDTSDVDASELDNFQRQATPPRLRSHSPPPARQNDVDMGGTSEPALSDEESTEDEDDLDRPSKTYAKRASPAAAAQPSPEAPSPSSPRASNIATQPSTTRGPFTHEEESDDDDDDLDAPSQPSQKASSTSQLASRQKSQTPQPTTTTTTTTKPSPRRTLGKLGGRLPAKSKSKSPTPPSEEEHSGHPRTANRPLTDGQPKPKPKLGTIGGSKAKAQAKAQSPTSPPAALPTSTTRSAAATTRQSKEEATPEPQPRPKSSRQQEKQQHADKTAETKAAVEQTEGERADAKREALKRELEAKAKAPVKKKRKF